MDDHLPIVSILHPRQFLRLAQAYEPHSKMCIKLHPKRHLSMDQMHLLSTSPGIHHCKKIIQHNIYLLILQLMS